MRIANQHDIFVVEDAAQAVDSFHIDEKGIRRPLGGMGHLGAMSFHETKNIISGEGGMLIINDERFIERAEIIWEKGTNRSSFFRGEVDKYGWVDIGSSFLMSELNAAYLFAQLLELEVIQKIRIEQFLEYQGFFKARSDLKTPNIPHHATLNGHMFFLLAGSLRERTEILNDLRELGLHAVFHYLSLHRSPVQSMNHDGRALVNSDRYTDQLFRLPIYPELPFSNVRKILQGYFN